MQSENPYAPPAVVEAPPVMGDAVGEPALASQGQRFANMLIDGVAIWLINNAVGFAAGVMLAITNMENGQVVITPEEMQRMNVVLFFIGLLFMVAYFTLLEAVWQRSLGKLITGTRVIRADGGRPTLGQIIGRSFARLIPFEAFSFLGGNGKPVGWHDSLSGTRVVKTR